MIIAYTDGACKGNGQTNAGGGFGSHIIYPNGDTLDVWGGEPSTTNNRMELMGAITALERTPADVPLQIWTDSSYVQKGISEWIKGWKAKNWKKSDGKPVLNVDLWQRLDALCQNRQIDWQWVKGHAGHHGNEIADLLANLGVSANGEKFTQNNQTKNTTQPTTSVMTQLTNNTPLATTGIERHNHQNPAYNGDTSKPNADFWLVLPDPINRGKSERQLIMDTETTGTEPQKGDRIVEVGIIEMVGRKFTGQQVHIYLNPDKEMDEEVIKVHGITNEFVKDKPKFADIAHHLYEFMKGGELIAHNAGFDMGFLKMEFDKVGLTDFLDVVQVTDSLALARQMYPGQKNSLDALRKRLDVGNQDRTFHGALLDSEILAEVYLAMTGGQISLSMEEEVVATEDDSEITFSNLSELAHLLLHSKADFESDGAWRANTIKNS
ncbi:DNA polymerase III subunit epsilon [Moraxella oblonga]|uniref:DNA polymerase III subunit epsilon n=1 Tax=Moraxella oblonga TaxID=200413 RepID=UPI0008332008|nr:DNA polymerase III subunit epsilon [Moraxella oblonga]